MRGSRGGRGSFRGGRGGSGGGAPRQDWSVPPTSVISVGTIMHPCEEYVVLKNEVKDKVPIFNRPLYLANKTKIGVVDDVFGPISDFMFSVKCDTGVNPKSFEEGQKLYMNPEHFLWMNRFLPKPLPDPLAAKPKKPKGSRPSGVGGAPRGGQRGGFRGGFNNARGSGGFRGAPRGGSNFRGAPRGGSGGFRGKN
jgi:H/ACA ribonucleoprotein complex subunit 1